MIRNSFLKKLLNKDDMANILFIGTIYSGKYPYKISCMVTVKTGTET